MVGVVLLIWLYVVLRAIKVPFTADEAATYATIHGDPTLADSANNQWLNTLLMRVSQSLFGQSELALRLPNVLSFGVYGAACIWIISGLRSYSARLIGFVLLLGDPFLIEFFGLARGYGLCLAFAAAALACLVAPMRGAGASRYTRRLLVMGLTANAAFYANFAALNFIIALLAVAVIDVAIRTSKRANWSDRQSFAACSAVLFVTGAGLVPGILQVAHLQAIGQLYYGGHHGLVPDTVGSLFSTWRYRREPPAPTWLEWFVAVLVVLAITSATVRYMRTRSWGNAQRAALIMALVVVAAEIESRLLGALYPVDRTALTYIIAFAALVGFVWDDLASPGRPWPARGGLGAITALILGLTVTNFATSSNLQSTLTWPFDASARRVIDATIAIERTHGRPSHSWKLVSGFPRNYALDYYRRSLRLTWLQPITHDPVSTPGGDLYDVSTDEIRSLPPGTKPLADFPEMRTQLRAGPHLSLTRGRHS